MTVVCLIIAPFSSRPPATLAVRGSFYGVLPYYRVCVSSITFLRVFPGFIAKPFRGGSGFCGAASSTHGLVSGTGIRRISHISAYAAHQGGLVIWYGLGRPVLLSGIGNRSVFVLF